jgi:pimeloyl-ACP methyl ester carboxylesterase
VGDTLAVLDKAGAERAVVVSWCGAGDELILAVEHPERVAGLVLIALLSISASHLSGVYGPIGEGGALLMLLVVALAVNFRSIFRPSCYAPSRNGR